MNFLSHFAYNHQVLGIEPRPHFVMGVALPDLWARFSRKRRIRWRSVRQAQPEDTRIAAMRDGLLNHAAVDQSFHVTPTFLRWIRDVKSDVPGGADAHPALLEFLAHVAVELALDHHLLREDRRAAEHFYEQLGACDIRFVEAEAGRLAGVDGRGLGEVIDRFVRRRFVFDYSSADAIVAIIFRVLGLTTVRLQPRWELVNAIVLRAIERAEPVQIWEELAAPASQTS